MSQEIIFRLNRGTEVEEFPPERLRQIAKAFRLDDYILGRYTNLFVFGLHFYMSEHGINPFQIIDEVKALEDPSCKSQTKEATEFKHAPLKGFWHKHFFSARFIPQNILTQLGSKGMMKIFQEEWKDGEILTAETIAKISDRIVVDSLDNRSMSSKLTGEWLVFAKHNGQNYYLTLATHTKTFEQDEELFKRIKTMCFPQFPFLLTSHTDGN